MWVEASSEKALRSWLDRAAEMDPFSQRTWEYSQAQYV